MREFVRIFTRLFHSNLLSRIDLIEYRLYRAPCEGYRIWSTIFFGSTFCVAIIKDLATIDGQSRPHPHLIVNINRSSRQMVSFQGVFFNISCISPASPSSATWVVSWTSQPTTPPGFEWLAMKIDWQLRAGYVVYVELVEIRWKEAGISRSSYGPCWRPARVIFTPSSTPPGCKCTSNYSTTTSPSTVALRPTKRQFSSPRFDHPRCAFQFQVFLNHSGKKFPPPLPRQF